ncbi:hypothetical protein ACFO5R_01830 [Halosolutus amylolyticus]|uniref:Uncharacterized protein n=1 Tax=Halosolutus amylolyticus TaxID=2932267 RepID=A0ABD5PJB6_9EURY|nr:hypothetical protein [Halosolutus amylolyticus]
MIRNLGPLGIVGLLIVVAGIGLIAWADPIVAVGMALVLAGLGLVVKALISNVLGAWGMM